MLCCLASASFPSIPLWPVLRLVCQKVYHETSMSQSVKTSASIATSPTTSTFCCYIFSSHLLTTGISVGRSMMTWKHIKTPPSSAQRPIRFPANWSKFPGTWSRQMAPSRSPLNASRCNMFKHYSWNTHGSVYVLDKGHSLQKFLNRFKGFEMFPHCPVRLFAGISFDLAFSCNQKVSARIA